MRRRSDGRTVTRPSRSLVLCFNSEPAVEARSATAWRLLTQQNTSVCFFGGILQFFFNCAKNILRKYERLEAMTFLLVLRFQLATEVHSYYPKKENNRACYLVIVRDGVTKLYECFTFLHENFHDIT